MTVIIIISTVCRIMTLCSNFVFKIFFALSLRNYQQCYFHSLKACIVQRSVNTCTRLE
jgi:hypothetical protein